MATDTVPTVGYVGIAEFFLGGASRGLSDAQLVELLDSQPKWDGLALLDPRGGLAGLNRAFPRAHAIVASRVRTNHGASALAWAVRNDERILRLSVASRELVGRLEEDATGALSLRRLLEFEHLSAAADALRFGYARAVASYKRHGDAAIFFWEALLGGDVAERAVRILRDAYDVQAAADARARLAKAREATGRSALGDVVAEHDVFGPNDELALDELLYPLDGCAEESEAIVFARIAGRAAAVEKVGARWYVYALSENLGYGDVWDEEVDEEGRSTVLPVGNARPKIALKEGYLLEAQGDAYFGGHLSGLPGKYWDADLAVLQARGAELSDGQLEALFMQMCLDFILVQLSDAEGRLAKALRDLDAGAAARLQIHTAALRWHLLTSARLAAELATRAPAPAEVDRLVASLIAAGRITHEDRVAATLIEDTRGAGDDDPPDDDDIVDPLAGKTSQEVLAFAVAELEQRRQNIGVTRRRMHRDPDSVMALENIHEQVMFRFPEHRVDTLQRAVDWHQFKEFAAAIGMAAGTAVLVFAGALTGGVAAVVAAGIGVGIGGHDTIASFRNARELAAMAEVDLADGVALATPDEVAWANASAWIGVAFTLLDVGGFARGVGQLARVRALVRTAEVSAALGTSGRSLRSVAQELRMSEDVLVDLLEGLEGPARDALLRRIRAATATRAGGARAGTSIRYTPEQVVRMSALLMGENDVPQVVRAVQAGGPHVDVPSLDAVKAYLFRSPGIGLHDYNIEWWRRLARGQATVADMATLQHELAEIAELRKTGFDFMGKGFAQLPPAAREQWLAAFESRQLAAHAKALEAEFDYLTNQVGAALRGEGEDLTRDVIAAIDPRGAQPGHRTDAYVHMRTSTGERLQNDPRLGGWLSAGRRPVTLTPAIRDRLGLTDPVTLSDLVQAVKHAPPSRTLVIAGAAPDPRTAGTGGIRRITRVLDQAANRDEIIIEGRLLAPIPRAAAPNYNLRPEWGRLRTEHGVPTYQAAHLWGPGFGDEAYAGILLAPDAVNLEWQNAGLESRVRELFAIAQARGVELHVKAVARNHARDVVGGASLAEVEYSLSLRRGASVQNVGHVSMKVEPPPSGRVYDVSVNWKL